eukprot:gene12335-14278_t
MIYSILIVYLIMQLYRPTSSFIVRQALIKSTRRRCFSETPASNERVWVDRFGTKSSHKEATSDESLKVVTYNVLGASHGEGNKHNYALGSVTNWNNRKNKLVEEMVAMNADIFCLQEVTEGGLLDTFVPALAPLGLDCHGFAPQRDPNPKRDPNQKKNFFQQRKININKNTPDAATTNNTATSADEDKTNSLPPPELATAEEALIPRRSEADSDPRHATIGSAIFCNKKKVEVLACKRVLLREFAPLQKCRSHVLQSDIASKFNSMVMALIRVKSTGKRVIVSNTHLFWDPKREDIKTMQLCGMAAALAEFMRVSGMDPAKPPPMIVCGDFNTGPYRMQPEDSNRVKLYTEELAAGTAPNTALFELLTSGTLSAEHPYHPDRWYAFLPTKPTCPRIGDLTIPFKLKNVFDAPFDAHAPVFTTRTDDFQGWLDHIFVSDKVTVEQVMVPPITRTEPLASYHCQTFQPMPNRQYASDHLPIGVIATFK